MASISIDGVNIAYDLLGLDSAPAIAITPGGRYSKDIPGIRELAQLLADQGLRVLIWDRPNTGASDPTLRGKANPGCRRGFW